MDVMANVITNKEIHTKTTQLSVINEDYINTLTFSCKLDNSWLDIISKTAWVQNLKFGMYYVDTLSFPKSRTQHKFLVKLDQPVVWCWLNLRMIKLLKTFFFFQLNHINIMKILFLQQLFNNPNEKYFLFYSFFTK